MYAATAATTMHLLPRVLVAFMKELCVLQFSNSNANRTFAES